ncbi:MAG: FAD-dependent monooxygenase, partial [Bacteroidota bacterium]
MITTDICIIGAGPGGAATALKLDRMGMPCVLIDKATFPRDKVCGDALSGKVLAILNRIDPAMMERFEATQKAIDVWGVKFVAPNETELDIAFVAKEKMYQQKSPGFVARRIDFDNFLIDEVRQCEHVDFHEGVKITEYRKVEGGYEVSDDSGQLQIRCRLLIDSSGAHSIFSRKFGGIKKEDHHYAAAVRAYYKNVHHFTEGNLIELHFVKD